MNGKTYPVATRCSTTRWCSRWAFVRWYRVERTVYDRHMEGRAVSGAGHTAVLKMSELSPLTADRLGERRWKPVFRQAC